jgi:hypothetical protein
MAQVVFCNGNIHLPNKLRQTLNLSISRVKKVKHNFPSVFGFFTFLELNSNFTPAAITHQQPAKFCLKNT